ncbi:MAG TPA: radical SAM protein [Stellaceae bacterium]|nr:radical SAM protein [Stellaceae bacterium]
MAIVTVAALVPNDFEIALCDECVDPVDLSRRPDFVGLTGKSGQWPRMRELAAEFRARGVCVIMGGPHVSLDPDLARSHCDILVRGEIEDIAEGFFADLRSGNWKREYVGTKPDLSRSPLPRWDLYPNEKALSGTLQTSRGCPFDCEFCDVIEYLGRKQRHKNIPQVLAELDELYRHGYRSAFLADDNFTVYRARTKELLAAIAEWNRRRTDGPMRFSTQVSIDAAGDEELLRMCADAGLGQVFIGIETPNEEALRIAKKRQNLKRDLAAEILRFIEHGICVDAGMIVGFDGDDPGIFQRQYDFATRCAVPVFSLYPLMAPRATPLFRRLQKAGRILDEDALAAEGPAGWWTTNIIPLGMSRAELRRGIQWLSRSLYSPEAFEARMTRFLDSFGAVHLSRLGARRSLDYRRVETDAVALAFRIGELGSAEAAMVRRIFRRMEQCPEAAYGGVTALSHYAQIRHSYPAEGPLEAPAPLPSVA